MNYETNIGAISLRTKGTYYDRRTKKEVRYVETTSGKIYQEFYLSDLDPTADPSDDEKAYVAIASHEHKPDPNNDNSPGFALRWVSMKYPYVRSKPVWAKDQRNVIFRWSPEYAAMPGFYEGITQELADEILAEERRNELKIDAFVQPITVVANSLGTMELEPPTPKRKAQANKNSSTASILG